jgi:gamma-glutamyltranspeptidase / glutathione hydrolase
MVAAADQLAASAGVFMLERGGSAADAVVAAGAGMAVVGPHLCGLGGDMLAVVKAPGKPPRALLGVGRAGSGADPDRLRADGHPDMPLRGDIRSVPVPGAVDGWLALHAAYGRLPWATVLEPAIELAEEGFAASLILALASHLVAELPGASQLCPNGPLHEGQRVRLPGIARTLRALATHGRDGFYHGEFGQALLALGDGQYAPEDLATDVAQWTEPLALSVFGHDLWTVPPPSQAYLSLAATWIAEHVGLPRDPSDPRWPQIFVEASEVAGVERPSALYDGADPARLLSGDALTRWAEVVDRARVGRSPFGRSRDGSFPSQVASPSHVASSSHVDGPTAEGDTTHLSAADADGLAVSLTQSNALDFGSHLVAGATGVFLHNRGVGFSLEPGHPAEYGPRRRPTHTLSPALVTRADGSVSHVVGAMGGDVQPQVIGQLVARMLHTGEDPATAVSAARVVLEAPGAPPFRLWQAPSRSPLIEAHAPDQWRPGLESRGHRVRVVGAFNPVELGCAQIVAVEERGDDRVLVGAADPRSPDGDAVGF